MLLSNINLFCKIIVSLLSSYFTNLILYHCIKLQYIPLFYLIYITQRLKFQNVSYNAHNIFIKGVFYCSNTCMSLCMFRSRVLFTSANVIIPRGIHKACKQVPCNSNAPSNILVSISIPNYPLVLHPLSVPVKPVHSCSLFAR